MRKTRSWERQLRSNLPLLSLSSILLFLFKNMERKKGERKDVRKRLSRRQMKRAQSGKGRELDGWGRWLFRVSRTKFELCPTLCARYRSVRSFVWLIRPCPGSRHPFVKKKLVLLRFLPRMTLNKEFLFIYHFFSCSIVSSFSHPSPFLITLFTLCWPKCWWCSLQPFKTSRSCHTWVAETCFNSLLQTLSVGCSSCCKKVETFFNWFVSVDFPFKQNCRCCRLLVQVTPCFWNIQ